ncbi:MAG: DUF2304 domain-containing protein [Anaerolineaceae bacterium]|nr:DUF2304 domain-containing protein [Anaerolineaceae bacterium]
MRILPSQIILFSILIIFSWYVLKVRTVLTDRIILIVLSVGGILLILYPQESTVIANRIGIGRGTDMIFYFFMLFCLFRFVGIAAERRATQKSLTDIVREMAIQNAQHGNPTQIHAKE